MWFAQRTRSRGTGARPIRLTVGKMPRRHPPRTGARTRGKKVGTITGLTRQVPTVPMYHARVPYDLNARRPWRTMPFPEAEYERRIAAVQERLRAEDLGAIVASSSDAGHPRCHGVDTAIVTGTVTSGCVRDAALDAFDFNCRVIVPVERVRQGEEERAMEARASYRR